MYMKRFAVLSEQWILIAVSESEKWCHALGQVLSQYLLPRKFKYGFIVLSIVSEIPGSVYIGVYIYFKECIIKYV